MEGSTPPYSFASVKKSLARRQYEKVETEISQARMVEMVKTGKPDIMLAATNQDMENILEPVRIPLYKGLLGHRIFLIRNDNPLRCNSIRTFDALQKLEMGLGATWADTFIFPF